MCIDTRIPQDLWENARRAGGFYFHVSEWSDMKLVGVCKLSDMKTQRKTTFIHENMNNAFTVFIHTSLVTAWSES